VNVQAEWDDFGRLPELIRNLKKDIEDIQESIEVNQGPDVRVDVDLGSPE
jgi:hypothetical protein